MGKKVVKKETIAAINMLHNGSTGRIMLYVAKAAREAGFTVTTYSTHMFSTKYTELPKAPEGHRYFGSYWGNMWHYIFARAFGRNGTYSRVSTWKLIRRLKADNVKLIHLHNLHGFCINLPMLFKYIKKNDIKVVWTLHDCWAMTGHCPHFDMVGCSKWQEGCHDCAQYKTFPESYVDDSRTMYVKKKKWFTGVKDLTIVTPSKWLASVVNKSFLKDYPVKVINNGIDLSVFSPCESDFRKKHNIEDKFIVLGVASGWGDKKGLDVFIDLADKLDDRYQIVLVGTCETTDKLLPDNIISIHATQNQQELAQIYTSADVFVNPTREDTFPTVNIESLACGTPVITFNTGGSSEIIDPTCGLVVNKNDINELLLAVEKVCVEKAFTSEACIQMAHKFDFKDKFIEYVDLYREKIS